MTNGQQNKEADAWSQAWKRSLVAKAAEAAAYKRLTTEREAYRKARAVTAKAVREEAKLRRKFREKRKEASNGEDFCFRKLKEECEEEQ